MFFLLHSTVFPPLLPLLYFSHFPSTTPKRIRKLLESGQHVTFMSTFARAAWKSAIFVRAEQGSFSAKLALFSLTSGWGGCGCPRGHAEAWRWHQTKLQCQDSWLPTCAQVCHWCLLGCHVTLGGMWEIFLYQDLCIWRGKYNSHFIP